MTNEFGVKLDVNGYAPSVVQPYDTGMCYRCERMGDLVRHEVFHGIKNRKTSKALGAWVYLCPECHNELHNLNPKIDWDLKRTSQLKVMAAYNWSIDDFIERFGRNYV